MKVGIIAAGTRIDTALADDVAALAKRALGARAPELVFHPQCFLSHGHFAGDDNARAAAFLDVANDPGFDALWFARGGYGANRIGALVLPKLNDAARAKQYLGYSDAGFLLAGLYKAGARRVAHGPMAVDLTREGGEAAVTRALDFLVGGNSGYEPHAAPDVNSAAFNITVLSHLLGTPLEPDLAGHVLMLEDVNEHMYRLDRALFHILSQPAMKTLKGVRIGRVAPVPPNDPDFGMDEEAVTRFWCAKTDAPYLGRADIGHDVDNKIVPFGLA